MHGTGVFLMFRFFKSYVQDVFCVYYRICEAFLKADDHLEITGKDK